MDFFCWGKWLNQVFRAFQSLRTPFRRSQRTFRPELLLLEDRITPVAGITGTKTVDLLTANPGDTLNYTVAIKNNLATDATGFQYVDTVDANTTFVSNSVQLSPM